MLAREVTTMSTAENIAALFHHDVRRFESPRGRIEDICEQQSVEYLEEDGTERYEFADGSSITIRSNFWHTSTTQN